MPGSLQTGFGNCRISTIARLASLANRAINGIGGKALRISIACKNIRFSTLLAAGDVTLGGIGNRELKNHDEVHDDDVC